MMLAPGSAIDPIEPLPPEGSELPFGAILRHLGCLSWLLYEVKEYMRNLMRKCQSQTPVVGRTSMSNPKMVFSMSGQALEIP